LDPSLAIARELVLTYGWNSTAYQILNPEMQHWFGPGNRAVAGYMRRGRTLLAAGAPVCAPEALRDSCAEFEAFADTRGCRVCYVCAGERMRGALAASRGHSAVVLGAQPAWDPRDWPGHLDRRASLRRQLNRSRNKSVEVECADAALGAADREVHAIFKEWLESRPLPPLRFLGAADIVSEGSRDRVVLVARRRGKAVAFLAASPIPARNGYLIELLARSQAAPNGTSELLIDAAMRRFAGERRVYLTLGLVALARAADREMRANPFWLRGLMRFARAHGNRFYHFRGLEHFRTKLAPRTWEPVYAISNEERFSARTLYAMAAAFSGLPPWLAIAIGGARSLRARRMPEASLAAEG
jgi:phosphatidylglycerol lysyltransferase